MQIHDEQIRYWIQRFQKGDTVSAFHGLVEAGREIIPEIIGLYNGTPDRKLKTFLINVIRCYCDPSTVSFFRDALFDSNSDVWKEALDGLVSIASQPALDALLSAKKRRFVNQQEAREYFEWLEEAIEQVIETTQATNSMSATSH